MSLAPAVLAIILNDDSTQVLLVQRRDIPMWVLPGGGIEPEETPEEAIIREVKEETGYLIRIIRKSAEYSPINSLSALTYTFIGKISSGIFSLSDETQAVRFFSLSLLPQGFFHIHLHWLREALQHSDCIHRKLTEISYAACMFYSIQHPWKFIRYAWIRFIKKQFS
jgi:8-oxo-dGTP diphosphatase